MCVEHAKCPDTTKQDGEGGGGDCGAETIGRIHQSHTQQFTPGVGDLWRRRGLAAARCEVRRFGG